MAVILAFGDSITYGSWSPVSTSWCSLLRSHMDSKFNGDYSSYGRVYNLGIGGETTEEAIKRFVPETQARLRNEEKVVFILAYGANDACFMPDKKQFKVTVERLSENVQHLVTEGKKISNKIILLNIIPVVDEANFDSEQIRANKYYEPYNQQLAQIAQNNSLTLVDANAAFKKTDYANLLGEDGLHPNKKGHQLIYDLISKEVDQLLDK